MAPVNTMVSSTRCCTRAPLPDTGPAALPGRALLRCGSLRSVALAWLQGLAWAGVLAGALLGAATVQAQAGATSAGTAIPNAVSGVQLEQGDDGLYLSMQLHFELPALVRDALYKGIPMYFVLEAQVARERWYWKIAEPGAVAPGAPYSVRLAFRIDTSQLARPFQIGALGSNGWSLALEHQVRAVVEARP